MNKEPDKYYKCVKIPLKSIIRFNSDIEKIMVSVNRGSKIVSYALQFIKLYCLDYYNKNKELPKINTEFIKCSLRVVCKDSGKKTKDSDLLDKFKEFYNNEFKYLNVEENLNYDGLATLFEYLVVEIITAFENNIKQRYLEYVKHFINAYFDKRAYRNYYMDNLKCKERDARIKILSDKLNNIYYDVLNLNDNKMRSDDSYISTIKFLKQIVLPNCLGNFATLSSLRSQNIEKINYYEYLNIHNKIIIYVEQG